MTPHELDGGALFYEGALPAALLGSDTHFEALWRLHPDRFHEIEMFGRLAPTPRWQQAYGVDYQYTGRVNLALPVPDRLAPYLEWAVAAIDTRLNGLLLNWYEPALGHYIGKHRDSTKNMVTGAPIVTISLGGERVFRLRRWKRRGYVDFIARDGSVFVMPYETNLAWTHEVPAATAHTRRRISITLRAFR